MFQIMNLFFSQALVPAKFGHCIVISEGGIHLIDRNWSTFVNYWCVGEQGVFKVFGPG